MHIFAVFATTVQEALSRSLAAVHGSPLHPAWASLGVVQQTAAKGGTYRSLTAEYGVSKASICKWCKEFSEECQKSSSENTTALHDLELMKENHRLREELAETKKKIFS